MTKHRPTPARLQPAHASRSRRGAQYIEFLILLPVWIFMMFLLLGIGEITLTQAALQDATQQIARTGAQQGGLGDGCVTGSICTTASQTYIDFAANIDAMPGGNSANIVAVNVNRGGGYECSAAAPYVTVTTSYQMDLNLPLANMFLQAAAPNFTLTASATARCDIGLPGA